MAPDAVVVGSGPNGLAAALTLAHAGLEVVVYEGAEEPGGGCRTLALTGPGFRHDHCSTVHPLVAASPYFSRLGLADDLVLRRPEVAFAHPLDDGRVAAVTGSVADTAAGLGPDGPAYRRLFEPLVAHGDAVVGAALSDFRSIPAHPIAVAPFALRGAAPASVLARCFAGDEGRALIAGAAAHAILPLDALVTGGYSLLMTTLAHTVGWPVVEGGSSRITDALIGRLEAAGGRVETGRWIRSLTDLPTARITVCDVTPGQLLALAGAALPTRRRAAYRRFRYGPAVCKVDWALDGPVPWTSEACRRTATVHVGGTWAEVATSEAEVAAGRHPERPFCIVVQASVADPTRAPAGHHTLWAYCHVPNGSTVDMTERIEAQIERYAPGWRDRIIARTTTMPADLEAANPNLVGGDIGGGAADVRQLIGRPLVRWRPYRTGIPGVYLGSSSTPPGGGVHGMGGHLAAQAALRDLRRPSARS